MKHYLWIVLFIPFFSQAQQLQFERNFDVPVIYSSNSLNFPWVGGLNNVHISEIDLNFDGIKDLFIFDKSVDKPFTFINDGSNYTYDASYEDKFPPLNSWALLRDYNCDGLEDIFSYATGGIQVWKNTSNITDGIQFELQTSLLLSKQGANTLNLYVSSIDIPAIDDVDGDGDLDVLTFDIFGTYLEYHKNLSVENHSGSCEELEYELYNTCWGHFSESGLGTNEIILNDVCNPNVTNPEIGTNDPDNTTKKHGAHAGSSVLSIDIDGNGVKDLLLGDATFSNTVMLINGGTSPNTNSAMISQDANFPSYDVPASINYFPAHFYVDVDNDGIRDLMVSPNNRNQSENAESIWFYKNIGTDDVPQFSLQKTDFLQEDMIDVGSSSFPVPFDYNNDGKIDLLIGNYGYYNRITDQYESRLMLLENTGTINTPEFTLVDADFLQLHTFGFKENLFPAIGDLDADGDKDLLIGDLQGNLHYFENKGTAEIPNFQLVTSPVKDNNNLTIDVGLFAYPFIFDVDLDGKLDLVIGERNGNLNYYRNVGTQSKFKFELISENFGEVNVTESGFVEGHSKPFMFRNRDGETQLLVGSEEGPIHHYNGIDGNLSGTFNEVEYSLANIDIGKNSSPMVADFDSDGKYDLLVGNFRGGIAYYKGLTISVGTKELELTSFKMFPNPTSSSFSIELKENAVIEIFSVDGVLHYTSNLARGIHQVDLQLPKAIYFVKITTENGNNSTKKLVIK